MTKKTILIITIILISVGLISIIMYNSDYHYSKKLISAVETEDVVSVKRILEEKPSCVNTVPALMPKWFYIFTDTERPTYALDIACRTDNLELVQVLINFGADVNGREQAIPLSTVYLIKKNHWYQMSLLLIENGATLDYITTYSGGNSSVLQDIVQSKGGASLPGYIPDSDHEVLLAFNYAIENCNHGKVEWANVLQQSVSNDRVEIVRLLLDKRLCDVNDTSLGITALMFAARDSTPVMVKLLLDFGADKSYRTADGKTAYDYAVQSNDKEILSLL